MGVQGLCTLLDRIYRKKKDYQDFFFCESKLVVDGTNLANYLYEKSDLDQNQGGEYLAYQVKVQAFFDSLKKCDITPYVVIDGSSGTSKIKCDIRLARQRALLKRIPEALTGEEVGFLPSFTSTVFVQTLNDLNVQLVRWFGEADGQLAALASECECPVLSRDTDFCIFDLPAGFLSLDHFQWDSVKQNGTSSHIPCKLYTTSSFCKYFNIDSQLLPLLASLANDYDNLKRFHWEQFLPADRPIDRPSTNADRLEGLLRWMGVRKDLTTQQGMLKAWMDHIPDMNPKAQSEVQTKVQNAMVKYELPSCSLLGFFSKGTAPPLPPEVWNCDSECIRASLARGDLGLDYDILFNRRKILWIQAESRDLQSSNLTSRPIRQVMYGLLLGQEGGEVEEWDRDGLELVSVKVLLGPLVQGAAQTLRLDSLLQADPAVRLQVCLETLGVEEETLEGVPAHLRLPVAVTRYWLWRASPEPTLLKALLMVMVQGELNRRTGGTTDWQGDTRHLSKPLDGVVAHSLNQWQACLKDASQLNLLLCKPLPEPLYAWLYQGRLVHQRQEQLQEREPEDIVQDDQFISLYRRLLGAVTQPDPGANRRAGGPEGQHGAPSPQHPG
ncbi:protein asteroid homolog 1-like isoform X1 [Gadus macrocephalus]|uniref:protein asteroid homolog 1-like isoform X1 n=1 Tax=Gadus macrocephalus TaxID=80720 RepID=UPI0028CB353E|nr:protein asteroid homolog 1-like isoform X1 [Gadus macrocephalus]